MKVIGLTGGIGSGKSTVLNLFKARGAAVFVADDVAKELLNNDALLKNQVIAHFGEESYRDGKLDRGYLANIVFNDAEKLKALNSLVHPRVRDVFKNKAATCTAEILIYEAAILFESGSNLHCDYIVLVLADLEQRIKRVVARDKVSEAQVRSRMQHQKDAYSLIHEVDFIVRNENLTSTEVQVATVFELLLKSIKK